MKLIIIRPRQFANSLRRYRVLVDDRLVARVSNGKDVEVELPPGRHRVAIRLNSIGSRPVEIEAGPGSVCRLRIASGLDRWGPLKVAKYLPMLASPAIPILCLASGYLFSDPYERNWFSLFLVPMVMLPSLIQFAAMYLWRDRLLWLEEDPTSDSSPRGLVLPGSDSPGVRVTIRDLMIAMAVLAVLMGASVEWTRFTRSNLYTQRASYHRQVEENHRQLEEELRKASTGFVTTSTTKIPALQAAARAGAMADYHAALRHKYEEAAAHRPIAVEPDPPAPPWP